MQMILEDEEATFAAASGAVTAEFLQLKVMKV